MKRKQLTHFQAHQRLARRNSRKLSLTFVSCLFLSAASYCLLTFLLFNQTNLKILSSGLWSTLVEGKSHFDAHNPKAAFATGLIVALICIAVILWAYYHKKRELEAEDATEIAALLGATRLPSSPTLRQQQYQNVVEEIAVASGIALPHVLYLPADNSINAFVTAGVNESVCITVSQGALDYLKREELQALVAHEFGHIVNRDVYLNNRLSAVLYGFFCIKSLLTYEIDHDDDSGFFSVSSFNRPDNEDNKDNSKKANSNGPISWLFQSDTGIRLGMLGYILLGVSWLMIFFGQLLQAAFSRQREWLADAHAVQYTRNKDALASVFQKAMALQTLQVDTPPVADENAHVLFINYHSKWLSTHPPIEKRLARYGQVFFQDELQALAYQLKQYQHQNQLLENQQREAQKKQSQRGGKAPVITAAGTVLGLANDDDDNTNNDDNRQPQNSSQFFIERFYPLLAIRQYQQNLITQPEMSLSDAAHALLAQFVFLSRHAAGDFQKPLKWSDKQLEAIKKHLESLNQLHPTTHIQHFIHHLPILKKHPKKATLIQQVNYIIKADKQLSLCEISYLLCLRHSLNPAKEESQRQQTATTLSAEIQHLIQVAAQISNDDTIKQQANYELLKNGVLPDKDLPYQPQTLDNHRIKQLYDDINRLTTLKAVYRKNLYQQMKKNSVFDGQLSVEQNHLLSALQLVFA